MSLELRTKLATILRQHEQCLLDDETAYHLICNLYAGE